MILSRFNIRQAQGQLLLLNSKSADPTRTMALRAKFVAEMRRRFKQLAKVIWETIVDNDALGLVSSSKTLKVQAAAPVGAFDFARTEDKIIAFMQWLEQQYELYIMSGGEQGLRILPTKQGSWMRLYLDSAYQRGIRRAREEMRKQGIAVPTYGRPGQDEIALAFNQPVNAERIALIYSRVFSDLKGITTSMDTLISRTLSQGLLEGRGPRNIAKMLDKIITGTGETLDMFDSLGRFIPGMRRAEIMARTEIIRAHHLATVQAYRDAGLEGVKVIVEWDTAGDGRVCKQCAELDGNVYSLSEIERMLPRHPQCRCVAIPAKEMFDAHS